MLFKSIMDWSDYKYLHWFYELMMNKYSIYMVNKSETPHNWKSLLLAKMISSVVGCGESEWTMPEPKNDIQFN